MIRDEPPPIGDEDRWLAEDGGEDWYPPPEDLTGPPADENKLARQAQAKLDAKRSALGIGQKTKQNPQGTKPFAPPPLKKEPAPPPPPEPSKAVLAVFRGRIEAVLAARVESAKGEFDLEAWQAVADAKGELADASAETLAWFARACRVTDESIVIRASEKWPIGPSEPGELAQAWQTVFALAVWRGRVPRMGFWPETVAPTEPWSWLRARLHRGFIGDGVPLGLPADLAALIRVAIEGSWPGHGSSAGGQVVYAPPEREPSEVGDNGLTAEGWKQWPRFKGLGPWALARLFEAARGDLPAFAPVLTKDRFSLVPKAVGSLSPYFGPTPLISVSEIESMGPACIPPLARGLTDPDHAIVPAGDFYLTTIESIDRRRKKPQRPHQLSLALDLPTEASSNLADGLCSMLALKVIFAFTADRTVRNGERVTVKLHELVRLVNMSAARIQARHYKALAESIREIPRLVMVDRSVDVGEQIFNVSLPRSQAGPDTDCYFGLSPNFLTRFGQLNSRAAGAFLIDLPAVMGLPNSPQHHGPEMIRLYSRLASMWAGCFDPRDNNAFASRFVQTYTKDELAALGNCLSIEAATALVERRGRRPKSVSHQLESARRKGRMAIEGLKKRNMIRVQEAKNGRFKVLPPKSLVAVRNGDPGDQS